MQKNPINYIIAIIDITKFLIAIKFHIIIISVLIFVVVFPIIITVIIIINTVLLFAIMFVISKLPSLLLDFAKRLFKPSYTDLLTYRYMLPQAMQIRRREHTQRRGEKRTSEDREQRRREGRRVGDLPFQRAITLGGQAGSLPSPSSSVPLSSFLQCLFFPPLPILSPLLSSPFPFYFAPHSLLALYPLLLPPALLLLPLSPFRSSPSPSTHPPPPLPRAPTSWPSIPLRSKPLLVPYLTVIARWRCSFIV